MEASSSQSADDLEAPRVIKEEPPDAIDEQDQECGDPLPVGPSSAQMQGGAESEPPMKKCKHKQSSSQSDDLTFAHHLQNSPEGEGESGLALVKISSLMFRPSSTYSDNSNNNSNDVSGDQDNETSREETIPNISKSKKKPPAKSLVSVEKIFARKIKEIKEIKKKECEVMKSIDGLDKQMSDLLKKRRDKIKELKELQKEERAVLNA